MKGSIANNAISTGSSIPSKVAVWNEAPSKAKDAEKTDNLTHLPPVGEALETKPPTTRAALEECIAEAQKDLDDALRGKEFAECARIQDRLDSLILKRSEMPNLKELQAALSRAETDVAKAVGRKDFTAASALQSEVDELKRQLQQMIQEEGNVEIEEASSDTTYGFKSRFELEEEIVSFTKKIEAAVASKDFSTAATLQMQVEKLEALRQELPTVAELEKLLVKTKKELGNAIALKRFEVADKLQKSVDDLEKKLCQEKGHGRNSSSAVQIPIPSARGVPSAISVSTPTKIPSSSSGRPVYRLRPRKPIVVQPQDSVLSVAQTIAKARGDAALVELQEKRGFAGVLTPHHITERVIAKDLDPASVSVSSVMKTKRAVALTDSAGDALSNMLENKHRYLPVMDDKNSLVGILDIGQCLNDAIKKLEHAEECNQKAAKDAVEQVATLKAGPGSHVNALQALLGPVLEQAFGNKASPVLRSLLKGKPSTIVSPDTNVREAAIMMARDDKAALVVDSGKLVGIVTVKNIMEKAVAKKVSLELNPVTSVMRAHPLHVSPDITALEALQIMQMDRVLSLPVCEDDGTVIGSVDVMDIIYGCGGAEGWRSIFDQSALLADDVSATSSSRRAKSGASMTFDERSQGPSARGVPSAISVSTPTKIPSSSSGRPVYRLRPRKPIVVQPQDSVLSVAQTIAKAQGDAALVELQEKRGFAGVLTPHHITERVIAKDLDPASVSVSSVMKTKRAVALTDSAGDALSNMLENKHRYLPVMDDKNSLVGILDIGQCLNDAIKKLEHAEECNQKAAKDAVEQVATLKAGPGSHVNALQALLGPVLEQAFGNKASPVLRSLLKGKPSTIVSPDTNVREAAIMMARDDKAALVVDSGKLVGIVTVKNIMEKAVAKKVSLELNPVTSVMRAHPLHVSPDITALEALQIMQMDRVLSLPVCEDDGTVIGSVDVMDIIYGCGGAEGWRSIFDQSALLADDMSSAASSLGGTGTTWSMTVTPKTAGSRKVKSITKMTADATPPTRSIPALVEIPETSSQCRSSVSELQFKVVFPNNCARRIRCKPSLETLQKILGSEFQLTYTDEEGDSILVASDECLLEAIDHAQLKGDSFVRLRANDASRKSSWWDTVKRSWQ